MKKIRLLLVATESGPAMVAFAVSVINSLSLDERFEIKALVQNGNGNRTYKNRFRNRVDVVYLNQPSAKVSRILSKIWPVNIIRHIRHIEKEWKPDCVHFLTGDPQISMYIFLCGKTSYSYVVHDLFPHEFHYTGICYYLMRKWVEFGYKINCKKIKNLTTCSKYQWEILKSWYPEKNISFTQFPSLVSDEAKRGTRQVEELVGCDEYFLFFGTTDKYKGVDLLLKAFVKSKYRQKCKLVVTDRSKKIHNPDDESIVILTRFIKEDELKDLFEKASLVIYPYKSATMSGVLSFPFFWGKRMLLSDVPFFKQYASSSVTFFRAGDADDLESKIEIALSSSEKKNDLYEEFFSEEKMNDACFSFFEKIVNRRG